MKILVFADIHGSMQGIDLALQIAQREKPHKTVFCGDLFGGWYGNEGEVARKAESIDSVLYFVLGNNDYPHNALLSNEMENNVLMYHFGRTLFFTHGHNYNGFRVPPLLKENDAIIFGHTHFGSLTKRNGLFVLNVGSLSRPRDGQPCYLVLDESGATLKSPSAQPIYTLPWE